MRVGGVAAVAVNGVPVSLRKVSSPPGRHRWPGGERDREIRATAEIVGGVYPRIGARCDVADGGHEVSAGGKAEHADLVRVYAELSGAPP